MRILRAHRGYSIARVAIAAAFLWITVAPVNSAAAQAIPPAEPKNAPPTDPAAPSTYPDKPVGDPADLPENRRLEEQVQTAFRAGEYAKAEEFIRRQIEIDPRNFVPRYNLACALARQSKIEAAELALQEAVAYGYADLTHLQSDPDLANIRETRTFKAIVERWDRILAKRAELNFEQLKERYKSREAGGKYTFERDESLRVLFVSSFDDVTFGQVKHELARMTRWWNAEVVGLRDKPAVGGGGGGGASADAGAETLRPGAPWVAVILPTQEDYRAWAMARYGAGWERVGGAYMHDRLELVSRDVGATLRHEFWHALHWRDMTSRGQRHPMWVMEGLCSLVEDVEDGPKGEMVVLPSWRTNMVKRLARSGGLLPWEQLFTLGHDRFMSSKPLAYYAQSRAVFVFLAQQGKLKEWYAAYGRTYGEDPGGGAAFVEAFGKPLKEIEKDYRKWLRTLPDVRDEIRTGTAILPLNLEQGAGDGLQVASVPPGIRAGGIRARDVVTAIDGKAIRDPNEYARILADFQPGEEVTVSYRRRDQHFEAKIKLISAP